MSKTPRKGINGTNWLCWKKRCLHGAFFYYLPYLSWTMAIYSIWFRDRSKAIDCKIWRFARIWRLVPRNFLTPITDSQVLSQKFSSEKCRCRNTMLKSSEKLRQAFGPEGDQWLCGKQWEETWQHTFSTNLIGSCYASNIVPQEIVSHTYISQSRGKPGPRCFNCLSPEKNGAHLFFRFASFFHQQNQHLHLSVSSELLLERKRVCGRERECAIMICLLMPPRYIHQITPLSKTVIPTMAAHF